MNSIDIIILIIGLVMAILMVLNTLKTFESLLIIINMTYAVSIYKEIRGDGTIYYNGNVKGVGRGIFGRTIKTESWVSGSLIEYYLYPFSKGATSFNSQGEALGRATRLMEDLQNVQEKALAQAKAKKVVSRKKIENV